MAVMTEIEGWREELEKLHKGPAYKELYPTPTWTGRGTPIPLSLFYDYVETLLAHQELQNALAEIVEWGKVDLTPDEELNIDTDPRVPRAAYSTLRDFTLWFNLKNPFGPYPARYQDYGKNVALSLIKRELPDLRCQQAQDAIIFVADKGIIDLTR